MEDLAKSDTWRVFRIMAELVEGFEALNNVGPAVTIFGSARVPPGSPYYNKCLKVAERKTVSPSFREGGPASWRRQTRAHRTLAACPSA